MAKLDLEGMFKNAVIAALVGAVVAFLLGLVSGMLAQYAWVMWLIHGLLLAWGASKLPKEADTIFDVLVITFIAMGILGFVGMLIQIPFLQWANVASVTSLLTTLTITVLALAIAEEINLDKYM